MNIPPKYEDVVAQLDAALETIALKHRDMVEAQTAVTGWARKYDALQQRLTVAEQRAGVMEKALMRIARPHDCGCLPCTGDCTSKLSLEITVDCMRDTAEAALKPAAKPHKCIECDSQYCHGVCVERGDDDERYKGAEGEGS